MTTSNVNLNSESAENWINQLQSLTKTDLSQVASLSQSAQVAKLLAVMSSFTAVEAPSSKSGNVALEAQLLAQLALFAEGAIEKSSQGASAAQSKRLMSLVAIMNLLSKDTSVASQAAPSPATPSSSNGLQLLSDTLEVSDALSAQQLTNNEVLVAQGKGQSSGADASLALAKKFLDNAEKTLKKFIDHEKKSPFIKFFEKLATVLVAVALTIAGFPELGAMLVVISFLTTPTIKLTTDLLVDMGVPKNIAEAIASVAVVVATVIASGGLSSLAEGAETVASTAEAEAPAVLAEADAAVETAEASQGIGSRIMDGLKSGWDSYTGAFKSLSPKAQMQILAFSQSLVQSNALVNVVNCAPQGEIQNIFKGIAGALQVLTGLVLGIGSAGAVMSSSASSVGTTQLSNALKLQRVAYAGESVVQVWDGTNKIEMGLDSAKLIYDQAGQEFAQQLGRVNNSTSSAAMNTVIKEMQADSASANALVQGVGKGYEAMSELIMQG